MSNTSKSKTVVPEAKQYLNNMKYEIANELGVNLKQGYNGDITARDAGYIGGYMVKHVCHERNMKFRRKNRKEPGYQQTIYYACELSI